MIMRQNQSNHDSMVRHVASFLVEYNYFDVKAHISGFDMPELITWSNTGKGHRPDVTAKGETLNLFEVETADSIHDQHTEDQWTLFSTFAREQKATFWVVVPKGTALKVDRRLKELNIQAKVWEVG